MRSGVSPSAEKVWLPCTVLSGEDAFSPAGVGCDDTTVSDGLDDVFL